MTREKILKIEILKDEQLDNISGGILIVQAQGCFEKDFATGQANFIPPAHIIKQQQIARRL